MVRSNGFIKPGESALPAFWSPLTERDEETLRAQNGGRAFDIASAVAAARRCRFGFPQAVVSYPLSFDGRPFPTLFWLTCPFLKRRCGELESAQKIAELEALFAVKGEETAAWHERYAALRLSLVDAGDVERLKSARPTMYAVLAESGVGGICWRTNPFAAKCLHLQTAAWFGLGYHPAEQWLVSELGELECQDARCGRCVCL